MPYSKISSIFDHVGCNSSTIKPKSDSSKREIPIPLFLAQALEKHRASQQAMRQAAGDHWQELDLVFCNEDGTYIWLNTFNKRFVRILEAP